MRLGVVVPNQGATIDGVAAQLARVEDLGLDSAWMPGIPNGPDILTLLAVAGRGTRRIEIGSAVVPAFPRHPAALAVQALATNDALGGRFTLGIGLSHQKVIEGHLGLSYERPVAFMHDYLAIVRPLLADGSVDHVGSRLRTRLRLDVARTAGSPPPVLVAALGAQMLRLAGRFADGTMTWMTGLSAIAGHVVPGVTAAAAAAGRPAPRILVSLPVLLTPDAEAGRARADEEYALYGRLPPYRAMLDREGAASPGEIALVGDETALSAALARLRDAGVTELQATPFGDAAEIDRTVEFLASRPAGPPTGSSAPPSPGDLGAPGPSPAPRPGPASRPSDAPAPDAPAPDAPAPDAPAPDAPGSRGRGTSPAAGSPGLPAPRVLGSSGHRPGSRSAGTASGPSTPDAFGHQGFGLGAGPPSPGTLGSGALRPGIRSAGTASGPSTPDALGRRGPGLGADPPPPEGCGPQGPGRGTGWG